MYTPLPPPWSHDWKFWQSKYRCPKRDADLKLKEKGNEEKENWVVSARGEEEKETNNEGKFLSLSRFTLLIEMTMYDKKDMRSLKNLIGNNIDS